MRVQIVENQPNHRDIGVGLIHQPPHLLSEVLHGAAGLSPRGASPGEAHR